jgi:hypothetical protein
VLLERVAVAPADWEEPAVQDDLDVVLRSFDCL